MRIIIKQFTGQNIWSDVFCVGALACEKGGQLSNTVLEKMKSENIIQEIDSLEIIELFWKHAELTNEVQKCKYYEIKNPIQK